jgi:plexin A
MCQGAGAGRAWAGALLGLLLVQLELLCCLGSPNAIVAKFYDPGVDRMNHLVVDKNTGRVYVGAVNRLYQFSPDLDLVMEEETGPKKDSPECSMIDCPREAVRKLLDNVNKALVIDYTTTRLISCGSLFQVRCFRVALELI